MYNIIPLVLILTSLGIILVITVKKFPMLASLDMEAIPAEKEARFKERIIGNRLKRTFYKWGTRVLGLVKPLVRLIGDFLKLTHNKLVNLRETYRKEPILKDLDPEQIIEKLFFDVSESIRKEDLETAEKKLIEIIGIDNRNVKAFKLLAGLYFDKKNYEEAKQTYEYILKLESDEEEAYGQPGNIASDGSGSLEPEDPAKAANKQRQRAQTYFDLTLALRAMDNLEEALSNLDKALSIEPNNPKYLDTMVEISIIKKDKVSAQKALEQLSAANPENQKLDELRKQIEELG